MAGILALAAAVGGGVLAVQYNRMVRALRKGRLTLQQADPPGSIPRLLAGWARPLIASAAIVVAGGSAAAVVQGGVSLLSGLVIFMGLSGGWWAAMGLVYVAAVERVTRERQQ